jgi:hypothetical protein
MQTHGRESSSQQALVKMYESWVIDRARRRDEFTPTASEENLTKVRELNFRVQELEPRRTALAELKGAAASVSTADKVAMLVVLELSRLNGSVLIERLTAQLAADPNARYFSPSNMADNCGCGCGCGCATLQRFPYEERIALHRQLKPFSIDPFSEAGISAEARDSLLVKDFLTAYESVGETVAKVDAARVASQRPAKG